MPDLPTYSYRPVLNAEPLLRTYSNLRSRANAGGTFFRARETGREGNRISVQVVAADSALVVTNYNQDIDEMVTGPFRVEFLANKLPPSRFIEIDQLTTSPRAAIYSISFKIAPAPPTLVSRQQVNLSAMVTVERTAFKGTLLNPSPTAAIRILPRIRVYPLQAVPGGWSIDALRVLVNASDPWIEMLPRRQDAQDDGEDAPALSDFTETFLQGGDGQPIYPDAESTGPTRSLIHINYAEDNSGNKQVVNQVYEWVGETARSGRWQPYD